MTDFMACEHPVDRKYVVSGRVIVCVDCEKDTLVVRWDEPGADPLGDIRRFVEMERASRADDPLRADPT